MSLSERKERISTWVDLFIKGCIYPYYEEKTFEQVDVDLLETHLDLLLSSNMYDFCDPLTKFQEEISLSTDVLPLTQELTDLFYTYFKNEPNFS